MSDNHNGRVAIIGIGIYPHGRHPTVSAAQMGTHAIRMALEDAGLTWRDIEFAVGGSMTAGMADSLVADLGLTGVPFVNVRNACATGASTLLTASTALHSGEAELAVVAGYDKHERGAFAIEPQQLGVDDWYARQGLMLTPQFFAMKIQRYMHDYGISQSTLAKVAAKAYRNGERNPTAFRREALSEAEIATSPMITPPLTKYMYCAPDEGAVAAVLATERKAAELGVLPVYLRGVALRTRNYGSLEVFSTSVSPVEAPPPTTPAAAAAFARAGVEPTDVDIAQLSDGEAGAEVMGMAETGLCEHGEQEDLIQRGATEIGGTLPINTDGGLIANGEPVGANGLRQVHEVVLQLRGGAADRQVPGDPQVGFTQVYGAPGVAACTVLSNT